MIIVGTKVTWTHTYKQGRSICMTTWRGVVQEIHAGTEEGKPPNAIVRRKGKDWRVPLSRLTEEGQPTELTRVFSADGEDPGR